jgi:tetratricopeptide (TPR) repeat protein
MLLGLIAIGAGANQAVADEPAMDVQTMIDGLAERDMDGLLDHFVQTRPIHDPAAQQRLKVVRAQMAAREATTEQARASAQDRARSALQKLIKQFPNRPRQPLWRTELAELLMVTLLRDRHRDASAFYAFGLPTGQQREQYETLVPKAYRLLIDAHDKLRARPGEEGGKDTHGEPGPALAHQLSSVIEQRRLPYYLAHSAFGLALLPDGHAWFTKPVNAEGGEASRGTSGALERQALLKKARKSIKPLASGEVAVADAARQGAISLLGRVLLRQGHPDRALAKLNKALDQTGNRRAAMLAALAKAEALHRRGDYERAYAWLGRIRTERPFIRDHLLHRLLVTDLHHRLLKHEADRTAGSNPDPFKPYRQLLAHDALDSAQRSGLRDFIDRRWVDRLSGDATLATQPPMVRLAVTRISRVDGQKLVQAGRSNNDSAKIKQGEHLLRRAVEAGRSLIDANDLIRRWAAEARFNVALAQYFLAPGENQTRVQSGQRLVQLAQQFPAEPIAKRAMDYGLQLLRSVHQQTEASEALRQAYVAAARDLFQSSFKSSRLAADERLYFGSAVLEPAGRYRAAAQHYNQVPSDHPDYFKCQGRRLLALLAHLRETGTDAATNRLRQATQTVKAAAEASAAEGSRRAASAQRARAAVTLAQAELAVRDGESDRALKLLEGFEKAHRETSGLLRRAMQRRLLLLLRDGRLDSAAAQAKRLMQRFPDKAASAIQKALDQLQQGQRAGTATRDDEPTDDGRTKATDTQRLHTAVQLTRLLDEWAQDRGIASEQQLAIRLDLIAAYRAAGQVDQARPLAEKLIQQKTHADKAQVIHQYAETLFAQGRDDTLKMAAEYYNKLIQGRDEHQGALFWNAWMRRLQINDRLGKQTAVIPQRVRQLRMTVDDNLGGEPYKSVLSRLADKHRAGG